MNLLRKPFAFASNQVTFFGWCNHCQYANLKMTLYLIVFFSFSLCKYNKRRVFLLENVYAVPITNCKYFFVPKTFTSLLYPVRYYFSSVL